VNVISYKLVGISPDLQVWCCWDKGELLDLEVKRSKTKVMIGSNIVRKGTLGIFKVIVSKVRITGNLSGKAIPVDGSPLKTT